MNKNSFKLDLLKQHSVYPCIGQHSQKNRTNRMCTYILISKDLAHTIWGAVNYEICRAEQHSEDPGKR